MFVVHIIPVYAGFGLDMIPVYWGFGLRHILGDRIWHCVDAIYWPTIWHKVVLTISPPSGIKHKIP
jgi:hypothetical protein